MDLPPPARLMASAAHPVVGPLQMEKADGKINRVALSARVAATFSIIALALFLPAGNPSWISGWTFLALFFGFIIAITAWLYRCNPGLLKERLRRRSSDQPGWDMILYPLIGALFFVWLSLMSLDAARFHWSLMPLWLQVGGGVILSCSFYLLYRTFRENSYLSPLVRIQHERGQTVVSTGPYKIVRHPMYAAIVVSVIGTSLLLGSWCGIPFGFLLICVLARRAVLEERVLREQLPGYLAYMAQVRYRLVPHIW
jgi:protein-S-isoprenylcysteine O-methyltransferase Ste14